MFGAQQTLELTLAEAKSLRQSADNDASGSDPMMKSRSSRRRRTLGLITTDRLPWPLLGEVREWRPDKSGVADVTAGILGVSRR